jgi:hypothetical protein
VLTAAAPAQQHAITIDRVVASVDGSAITQSDVEQEFRLELFLEEGRIPVGAPSGGALNAALNRLIDQRLLAGEVEAQGFSNRNVQGAVDRSFSDIRKRFRSDGAFRAALGSLGMNENQLRLKLEQQIRIVQLTDQRMRPDAKPSSTEVEAYYRGTFLPEFARRGQGLAPPLSEVEDQIVEILVQKKIGVLVEDWIKELRSAHQVRIFSSGA